MNENRNSDYDSDMVFSWMLGSNREAPPPPLEHYYEDLHNQFLVPKKSSPLHLAYTLYVQTWGTSALGFDARNPMALQAFYQAWTVVVRDNQSGRAFVYFGHELAYIIDPITSGLKGVTTFEADLYDHNLERQTRAITKYGAMLPNFSSEPD